MSVDLDDAEKAAMPDELSRLEWHKKASANLRVFLAELEAQLVSRPLPNMNATEQLIVEIKRRLALLDGLIAEGEAGEAQAAKPPS
jgi:hypothetical protein